MIFQPKQYLTEYFPIESSNYWLNFVQQELQSDMNKLCEIKIFQDIISEDFTQC